MYVVRVVHKKPTVYIVHISECIRMVVVNWSVVGSLIYSLKMLNLHWEYSINQMNMIMYFVFLSRINCWCVNKIYRLLLSYSDIVFCTVIKRVQWNYRVSYCDILYAWWPVSVVKHKQYSWASLNARVHFINQIWMCAFYSVHLFSTLLLLFHQLRGKCGPQTKKRLIKFIYILFCWRS